MNRQTITLGCTLQNSKGQHVSPKEIYYDGILTHCNTFYKIEELFGIPLTEHTIDNTQLGSSTLTLREEGLDIMRTNRPNIWRLFDTTTNATITTLEYYHELELLCFNLTGFTLTDINYYEH